MNPSGIKHATFRLVAQSLKQLCHHVPSVSELLLAVYLKLYESYHSVIYKYI